MVKVRPVRLSWLIRTRRISPFSPISLACEKLGVEWLMMFDEYIYGPSPGILETLDLLLTGLKPKSFLDLFGGSGALSKLALMRGVRSAVYIDLYPEAAKRNLRREKGIKIIRGDALKFLGEGSYDVVAADPPEELIDKLLERLDAFKKIFRKAALIWIGPVESSHKRVKFLRNERMILTINVWGDSFAILWKPGLRSTIMRLKTLLS